MARIAPPQLKVNWILMLGCGIYRYYRRCQYFFNNHRPMCCVTSVLTLSARGPTLDVNSDSVAPN